MVHNVEEYIKALPPVDNSIRVVRIQQLVAEVKSCQLDAQSHQDNYKIICQQAYGALQDYLKSNNMETTDELVKETIKALPLDQQQQILDRLKELSQPPGATLFYDLEQLTKFMFWGSLISGGFTLLAPRYFQAKAWFISARSNAILQATRAGRGFVGPGGTILTITKAERAGLLEGLKADMEFMQGELLNSTKESLSIETEEEVLLGEQITKAEQAINKIEAVGTAEAEGLAAAGRITVWTKVFFVVSILVIAGLAIYDDVKEKELETKMEAELREYIKTLCTARLYSRVAERMELTHTSQISSINMLAQALKENNQAAKEFVLRQFKETVSNALKSINETTTLEMLQDLDIDSKVNIREDPDMKEMMEIRKKQLAVEKRA